MHHEGCCPLGAVNGIKHLPTNPTISQRLLANPIVHVEVIFAKDEVLTLNLHHTIGVEDTTSREEPTEVEDKG